MAVFVDNSAQSLEVLHKNIDRCDLRHCTRTIHWDIAKSLNCLKAYPRAFDLVLMDPPYRKGLLAVAIQHVLQSRCLAPNAVLVTEHEASDPPVTELPYLVCVDRRRYGRTGISLFSYSGV